MPIHTWSFWRLEYVVHDDNDDFDNLAKEIRAEAVTVRSLNLTDTDQVNQHQNLSQNIVKAG